MTHSAVCSRKPTPAATQVTNTYDSCTNGIGYLCIASSTAAKTQNAYDILGRITYATTTIAGNGYTSSYTYDRQGNITNITYPNGSQVSYTYNLAGQLSRVQNKAFGGSWADIASSLDLCAARSYLDALLRQRRIDARGVTTPTPCTASRNCKPTAKAERRYKNSLTPTTPSATSRNS